MNWLVYLWLEPSPESPRPAKKTGPEKHEVNKNIRLSRNIAIHENEPLKNESVRNNPTTSNRRKDYNYEMKQPKKSQHDDNMTRLYQNHININNAKKVFGRNNYESVNKVFENKKLYEYIGNCL